MLVCRIVCGIETLAFLDFLSLLSLCFHQPWVVLLLLYPTPHPNPHPNPRLNPRQPPPLLPPLPPQHKPLLLLALQLPILIVEEMAEETAAEMAMEIAVEMAMEMAVEMAVEIAVGMAVEVMAEMVAAIVRNLAQEVALQILELPPQVMGMGEATHPPQDPEGVMFPIQVVQLSQAQVPPWALRFHLPLRGPHLGQCQTDLSFWVAAQLPEWSRLM